MPTIKQFEAWLTSPEAARELGVSRQYMHKMLNEHKRFSAANTRLGWLVDPKGEEFVLERERRRRDRLLKGRAS